VSAFNSESRHPPLADSNDVNEEKIVISCLTNKPPKTPGQADKY